MNKKVLAFVTLSFFALTLVNAGLVTYISQTSQDVSISESVIGIGSDTLSTDIIDTLEKVILISPFFSLNELIKSFLQIILSSEIESKLWTSSGRGPKRSSSSETILPRSRSVWIEDIFL